jgi:nucleotide-binding universal stress UspA family protein
MITRERLSVSYQRPEAEVETLVERSEDDHGAVKQSMVNRILVATDTSAGGDAAVEHAAALARAHRAELHVLYVEPPLDPREVFAPEKLPDVGHVEEHLEGMQDRFPDLKVDTRQETGHLAMTVCAVAEQSGSDVIVLGQPRTNGKGRVRLRGLPLWVMRHSPCSVFLVDTTRA